MYPARTRRCQKETVAERGPRVGSGVGITRRLDGIMMHEENGSRIGGGWGGVNSGKALLPRKRGASLSRVSRGVSRTSVRRLTQKRSVR